jgi:hypothetical protein
MSLGIPRLVPFLENSAYNEIRFYFIRIDRGNFLEAAKTVLSLLFLARILLS